MYIYMYMDMNMNMNMDIDMNMNMDMENIRFSASRTRFWLKLSLHIYGFRCLIALSIQKWARNNLSLQSFIFWKELCWPEEGK